MARAQNVLPILAVGTGICTFSMMDAAMKGASLMAGVYTALFLRCLLAAAASSYLKCGAQSEEQVGARAGGSVSSAR